MSVRVRGWLGVCADIFGRTFTYTRHTILLSNFFLWTFILITNKFDLFLENNPFAVQNPNPGPPHSQGPIYFRILLANNIALLTITELKVYTSMKNTIKWWNMDTLVGQFTKMD